MVQPFPSALVSGQEMVRPKKVPGECASLRSGPLWYFGWQQNERDIPMRWKPYLIPMRNLSAEEAKAFLADRQEGSYVLLDVRQPAEYEQQRIPGGLLVPLPELMDKLNDLDRSKPTIVYCRSGNRSRMAAQYMSGQGFQEVYNLEGGILAWEGGTAIGPMSAGMELITGTETPSEILLVAYAMEEGLRGFYEQMSATSSHPPASKLFDKLMLIEVRHKEMVFELYREHGGTADSLEKLEEQVIPSVMEGGVTTEEFLSGNRHLLGSVPDIVAMAMTIELQALDLYVRYAQRTGQPVTQEVLHKLADEEKAHLRLLGNLLDDVSRPTPPSTRPQD
jgi:rhodanese-related sulfurtransferase/rubrerythrin